MPVPSGELLAQTPPRKKARKSKLDPEPKPKIWTPTRQSKYLPYAVSSCFDAVSKCQLDGFDDDQGRSGIGPNYNKRHGSLVDQQLKIRVAHGSKALLDRTRGPMMGGIDPCTATLLDYIESEKKQKIASTQAPLYSATMGAATAFDVMTQDGTIYEIKSTTVVDPDAVERGDKSYETPRARLSKTGLRGLPCSHYSVGQVQLHLTRAMVEEMTKWKPHSAAVLRVSPRRVRHYDLNPYFESRAQKLQRAIAQQTGQHKHNQRTKRHQQPMKKV